MTKKVFDFYTTYKDSLPPVPEKYTFSVIDLPFVAGNKSENKIKQFLDSLKYNIENNRMSFDSLAQIYSQDPGSAPSGGYLGYTSRGSLVGRFEEVAFSLNPFEISPPIKTEFGYHLIRLIDKQGEKISTQHILRTVDFSKQDKDVVFSFIKNLVSDTLISPGVFDSLAHTYAKEYNNNSGKYVDFSPKNIPKKILSNLKLLGSRGISSPIETDRGCMLIYYYNHHKQEIPNLINSWNLIYNYAKQEKQNVVFQNFVKKTKPKTYIKTFY